MFVFPGNDRWPRPGTLAQRHVGPGLPSGGAAALPTPATGVHPVPLAPLESKGRAGRKLWPGSQPYCGMTEGQVT